MNPGGGGCNEPRLRHCTRVWVTERDSTSKKKRKKERKRKRKQKNTGRHGGYRGYGEHLIAPYILDALAYIVAMCTNLHNRHLQHRLLPRLF